MDRKPKYALVEIERRWLVDLAAVGDLSVLPYRDIEDRYIEGARLRLRRIDEPGEGATFKFAKKYGRGTALSEAITIGVTQLALTGPKSALFEEPCLRFSLCLAD